MTVTQLDWGCGREAGVLSGRGEGARAQRPGMRRAASSDAGRRAKARREDPAGRSGVTEGARARSDYCNYPVSATVSRYSSCGILAFQVWRHKTRVTT